MLQFIVGRLKEKPFNISIRAVDFDDKHPDEHLQILNDVLASLNTDLKADLRVVSRDTAVENMRHFLMRHKCKCVLPDHNDGFGQKEVIYQILHWVLSDYELLRKEEYLARYLTPFDIPSEYHLSMPTNGSLRELLDAYKELQAEFIEVHKQFTATNADCTTSTDTLENINQLEAEKRQLQDRLQREQAQINNSTDFQGLLAQASEMRQAQDDELRLEQQREDQLLSLTFTKQRFKQVKHVLQLIETFEGKTIEDIVEEIDHEYQQAVRHLEASAIPERQTAELMLLQAQKEADSDNVDEGDGYYEDIAAEIDERLTRKQMELEQLGDQARKSNNWTMLKKELNDAITKLLALRDDIHNMMLLKELLVSKNDELSDFIKSMDGEERIQQLGGRCVSSNDVAVLREEIIKNREVCDNFKLEIMAMEASLSELQKTEHAIKRQQHEILSHHQKEERIAGVTEFNDISNKLVATSKETVSLNTLKAKTLEDISNVVQEIAQTLEMKQHELKPKIKELKVKRKQFHDHQTIHDRDKARYYETLDTLTDEHRELEIECSRLRQVWLEKESNTQLLNLQDDMTSISTRNLDWEKFRRAQQQRRSNEYLSNQMVMFASLKKLLDFKLKATGELGKQ